MYMPKIQDLGGVGDFEFHRPGDCIEGWVVDMIGWAVDRKPLAAKIKTDRGTWIVQVAPKMELLWKHLYKKVRITYLGKIWDAEVHQLFRDFSVTVIEE